MQRKKGMHIYDMVLQLVLLGKCVSVRLDQPLELLCQLAVHLNDILPGLRIILACTRRSYHNWVSVIQVSAAVPRCAGLSICQATRIYTPRSQLGNATA